jgi:D-threo-aldose 1-dehydrogenase
MPLSKTPLNLTPVIFGTSGLGNLYVALHKDVKCQIVKESIEQSTIPAFFDSAGKYGAGLALESLGECLRDLDVKPENVVISNKLGWLRTELTTPEPTFEPGVWRDLKFDAVQKISYHGILECFEQGNQLLGGYIPQMVSVHDPDEYLDAAANEDDRNKRFQDVLEAYKALAELKAQGKVKTIGVGAKKWTAIKEITDHVRLDWVMIANSMTIKTHPDDLLSFMQTLASQGIQIINSAVFNAGFLIGGDYYNYRLVSRENPTDVALFNWRDEFYNICNQFDIKPAVACVQFALKMPGVTSIALSTTEPKRVKSNADMATAVIPNELWEALHQKQLISSGAFSIITKQSIL